MSDVAWVIGHELYPGQSCTTTGSCASAPPQANQHTKPASTAAPAGLGKRSKVIFNPLRNGGRPVERKRIGQVRQMRPGFPNTLEGFFIT